MNFKLKTVPLRNQFLTKIIMGKPFFVAIISILFLYACSTEKNAFLNKQYHYGTVKFNGYFNGNEAYKLAKKNIAESHKDDYDELLDVFKYGNETDNKTEYPNLDRATKKGAKMIDRHSMKFKVKTQEVEFNQMIDDCYLLIGKARFLKYDLESAKETFLYVQNTYEKGMERYKATLWLLMTYIYQENFVDAETLLKATKENKEFPEKFKDELALIEAISFKRSGQFEKAIPAFEKAIEDVKKRKLKRRIQFILGQLYQQKGDTKKASELYEIVAKKATNYDLQFNAKINLATTYEGNAREIIVLLQKMLKDSKNKDYFDQIYFALAQVYERQGNEDMTIKCYQLSAKTSVKNKKQKGKAFLALGDYYFDQPDYLKASNYYDSTLLIIDKKFPDYEVIANKKESLKDLVRHLKIVEEQDSLLKIASMSDAEREEFIEQKIQAARVKAEEEENKKEAAREKALNDALLQQNTGSAWIFDNPTALASGLAEFQGLWGDRPLEDDWRRSDKTSLTFNNLEQEEQDEVEKIPENQTAEYYMKNLPLAMDQQEVAKEKVLNSYYQLGVLYRDNFNDLPSSNFYFEKLNARFPKNPKEAVTWYQLYRNYDKTGNLEQKADVKQKVIKNYPESEYAQLLINPNMLAEQEQKAVVHEKVYEEVFQLYNAENYEEVIIRVEAYQGNLQAGELKGQFELIHAFSKGNLGGEDSLKHYLKKVYSNNLGTEIANEVDVLLGELRRKKDMEALAKKDSINADKKFVMSSGEPHYFMIIFGNETNKSDDVVNGITDFNNQYFSNLPLKVKSVAWNEKENAVIVKPFKTDKEWGNYYNTIKEKYLNESKELGDVYFNISTTNYKKLFQYKEVLRYVDFFQRTYGPRG